MPHYESSLLWFRRDLRCTDHAALYAALSQSKKVFCVFIFDQAILESLPRIDRRVDFIHASLLELDTQLRAMGGGLIVQHAYAVDTIPALAEALQVDCVFANRDYEPQAIARDALVAQSLAAGGRRFETFKDQVIFEKDEVLTLAGQTFSVFTPYKNAWLKKLHAQADEGSDFPGLQSYPVAAVSHRLVQPPAHLSQGVPALAALGFSASNLDALQIPCGMSGAIALRQDFAARIGRYDTARDFPAVKGPSYLSVHLRFGTVSIRELVRSAIDADRRGDGAGAAVWLSELIWRDFYFMILHRHPHVAERAFKPAYDAIEWETGPQADQLFLAWCQGQTGYPLVDAAMLQLNQTGYMHNRLRMVTACFLVKDLGIDWRWGEHYFARHLNDYDLAANNGGWQWAASTGCDAQPYFRIFNPVTQSEKFDADGKFIRRYLPQLAKLPAKQVHAPWLLSASQLQQAAIVLGKDYPHPVVQHDTARKRTLERYAVVKAA